MNRFPAGSRVLVGQRKRIATVKSVFDSPDPKMMGEYRHEVLVDGETEALAVMGCDLEAMPQVHGDLRNNDCTVHNPDDYKFAELALAEARQSEPEDFEPHPKVGAVIVNRGKVVAAAHRGEVERGNHAEYVALEKKLGDDLVAGATVYTTLEPCTTRTHPKVPCAERLVERRVARVVIGMLDPDERIRGRGVLRLRDADIRVDFFPHDLMKQVEELNRDFTRHCKKQTHRESSKVPGIAFGCLLSLPCALALTRAGISPAPAILYWLVFVVLSGLSMDARLFDSVSELLGFAFIPSLTLIITLSFRGALSWISGAAYLVVASIDPVRPNEASIIKIGLLYAFIFVVTAPGIVMASLSRRPTVDLAKAVWQTNRRK